MNLNELQTGMDLPGVQKHVTRENIQRYAQASRDFNPIHIDEEFARSTPAGGIIAHGMLVLAYVSQMMTAAFGKYWISGGRFNVRFKAPARPGDTLDIQGKIEKLQKDVDQTVVNCSVLCSNQKGETVINGEAIVRIKHD
jgi:3-hydroxybutyryl-CoA dehydratase